VSDDQEQLPGVPLAPPLVGAVTFVPEGFSGPTVGAQVTAPDRTHTGGCPDRPEGA
jgi:hypothetical protein